MDVRPHPHINLATVTWLFEGVIDHRDSLGTFSTIRPGQVNLMTAGRGIVHWNARRQKRNCGSEALRADLGRPTGARRSIPIRGGEELADCRGRAREGDQIMGELG